MSWLLVLRTALLLAFTNMLVLEIEHGLNTAYGKAQDPRYPTKLTLVALLFTAFIASMGWLTP